MKSLTWTIYINIKRSISPVNIQITSLNNSSIQAYRGAAIVLTRNIMFKFQTISSTHQVFFSMKNSDSVCMALTYTVVMMEKLNGLDRRLATASLWPLKPVNFLGKWDLYIWLPESENHLYPSRPRHSSNILLLVHSSKAFALTSLLNLHT